MLGNFIWCRGCIYRAIAFAQITAGHADYGKPPIYECVHPQPDVFDGGCNSKPQRREGVVQ